jgi:hypothetical protein
MSGNVWEWCLNEYNHPERTELSGDVPRVLRGGSWDRGRASARTPSRFRDFARNRYDGVGLRVVRSSHIVLPLSTAWLGCLACLAGASMSTDSVGTDALPALAADHGLRPEAKG